MHGLNCLFFFSSALFIHWHLVHISCLKADWLELLQRWTSNYFYFPTRKVRSEVNYFTKIRTPSWTAYCYNSWPTRKCHCLAPRSRVEQDLNRSPRQIWGGLTLTAWFFSSLSAPVPFSACQLRLCPLLSHGTALEAWGKKGKSYHFTLVCCHGNQPTVGTLRQWYARKLCGPLCQSGCSTLVFFLFFFSKVPCSLHLVPALFLSLLLLTLVLFYHGGSLLCVSPLMTGDNTLMYFISFVLLRCYSVLLLTFNVLSFILSFFLYVEKLRLVLINCFF